MTVRKKIDPEINLRAVRKALPHDSAEKHVAGEAIYIDDIPEPRNLLHAYIRMSDIAHGRIKKLDLTPVRAMPGVAAAMSAADLSHGNDIGPGFAGDPVFADKIVEYAGQSVFAVAADTRERARAAAMKAIVEYDELPAILTIEEALKQKAQVLPTISLTRGDARKAIAKARRKISGRLAIGGQDHFYLEGQIAMAVSGEDGDMLVYSSTQHPSEIQHHVAHILGLQSHAVTVETRRMGGGFGGKETQGALFAVVAALLAQKSGRPVKLRVDRDDDMILTGKRHDFIADYEVGFDDDGRIRGVDFMLASRCGMSPDLSGPVNDRAVFHADNAYYLPHARIVSHRCKTNTVSNTAFRGFGGPQGMMVIEYAIDEIARTLNLDPLTVRKRNLYGKRDRNITPYTMKVEDNILPELIGELEESAHYWQRRQDIVSWNASSPFLKRGLALTPVKFGISFTATVFNQAGALVLVYTDGSVKLNHGGTEMGQGLNTKVAQIVADEFGIDFAQVKITATTTGKVPNTSATAASSGTDLNGKAAQVAARTIRDRLVKFSAAHFKVAPGKIVFADNQVRIGKKTMSFAELIKLAYAKRIALSATGYFATPKVLYDPVTMRGRPFFYFAYGAAVSEVVIDTLTGEYKIERVDILHDVGKSINPAIDMGQIEGGFIQGVGWLTSEELYWDGKGRLQTHAPSTYKIPACSDMPRQFNARIAEWSRNREDVVYRSKAVGEPPLMLGISVFHAIKDAIAAVCDYQASPHLDAPATPERVLNTIDALRAKVGGEIPLREAAE
ncbi:MAG TPA: xanthine dehydrogenase molybdopterin binding subunit [Stellaceae bacterium]|nr:xanthine dehydrogenase molybdopterin binding subunit [Stellaceae bacterium]